MKTDLLKNTFTIYKTYLFDFLFYQQTAIKPFYFFNHE